MKDKVKERRNHERNEVAYSATVSHEDVVLSCVIRNVSSRGAYLRIDDSESLPEDLVGGMVMIAALDGEEISARVLRLEKENRGRGVAVYFTDMVTFL